MDTVWVWVLTILGLSLLLFSVIILIKECIQWVRIRSAAVELEIPRTEEVEVCMEVPIVKKVRQALRDHRDRQAHQACRVMEA